MEKAKYSAKDIAQWFINRGILDAERFKESPVETDYVSNLKLQKLLYYAQSCSLAREDKKLFDENIEAWDYGPVVGDVYREFKVCGNQGIKYKEPVEIDQDTAVLLEFIYSRFGRYNAGYLVDLTHGEEAYKNSYVPNKNVVMSDDAIKKSFVNNWLCEVDIDSNKDKYSAMAETCYLFSIPDFVEEIEEARNAPKDDCEEIDFTEWDIK